MQNSNLKTIELEKQPLKIFDFEKLFSNAPKRWWSQQRCVWNAQKLYLKLLKTGSLSTSCFEFFFLEKKNNYLKLFFRTKTTTLAGKNQQQTNDWLEILHQYVLGKTIYEGIMDKRGNCFDIVNDLRKIIKLWIGISWESLGLRIEDSGLGTFSDMQKHKLVNIRI